MKVHIGEEIAKRFQQSGLKMPYFAEQLSTGERNVYSLFKRDDISAEMLTKISKVLNFNFFALYERKIPESIVRESVENYGERKKITINISLVGDMEDYKEHFAEILENVNKMVLQFGFKLS